MTISRLCLGIGIAAAFPAILLARLPAAAPPKKVTGKIDRAASVRERFLGDDPASAAPVVKPTSATATYRVIEAEFASPLGRAAFASLAGLKPDAILDATDRFLLFFVPADESGVATMATLKLSARRWETVRTLNLPPPTVLRQLTYRGGTPDEVVRGGISGLTGKGVVLAVIDSGIDFQIGRAHV